MAKNTSSNMNYDKLTTICKDIFEEQRKAVRGAASNPEFRVINELSVDFDGPRFHRRIKATTNTYALSLAVAQKHVPKHIQKRFHILDDWIHLGALPLQSIDSLNDQYRFTLAAAIWILDVLSAYGLTDTVLSYLPKDQKTLNSVDIGEFWDPCHSMDVLRGLVYVIDHRNDDCVGSQTDAGQARRRVLLDDFTATNTQHQNVPSRQRFEAILSLIPQADLEETVHNYRAVYLRCLERYYKLEGKAYAELFACGDELDKLEEDRNKMDLVLPKSATPIPSPLLFTEKETSDSVKFALSSPSSSPARIDYMSQLVSQIKTTHSYMDRSRELLKEYDRLEDMADNLLVWSCSNSLRSRSYWEGKIGKQYAEIMTSLQVEDPFEMCFAYLYLLETDSDLPWLMYASSCILDSCAAMLPWNFDHPDIVEKIDDNASEDDKTVFPYAFISENSDGERTSLARSIYDLSGCLLPRELNIYDVFGPILSETYNFSDADKDKTLAYLAILAAARDRTELPYEKLYKEVSQTLDERDSDIKSLRDTISRLKAENDTLRKELHSKEHSIRSLDEKLELFEKQRKLELLELSDLREFVYAHSQESFQESDQPTEIRFPHKVEHRTVVFGGHDSWAKAIKPMLPDVRFVLHATPNSDIIRNAEVVWIQTNSLSHSNFYKIIDTVRSYNIPIRYFGFSSAEKCATQIVEYDLELTSKSE